MSEIKIGAASLEPWIGLIHVRPIPGKTPMGAGVRGAYVQMVALARDATEFKKLVVDDLLLDDLVMIEAEDIATVESFRADGRISAELDELIHSLCDKTSVKADVFAPYTENPQ